MKISRIVIYSSDVQRITGKSDRSSRLLLSRIRKQNAKASHQLVSVDEFCSFTGLKPDQVTLYLSD